jgi:hypothetical protein
MAELKSTVTVTYTCHLVLTEGEMRALDALAGYGIKPFLEVFYAKLGKHYLSPHEKDLRTLFKKIRDDGGKQLHVIDEARKLLEGL